MDDHETAPALGPVGYRVILENELVRVWQVALEPGQTQALHHHEHPYLVIAIEGAINVVETLDGQRRDAPEPTGSVVFRPPGDTHTLTNVGETRYVSRIVELKQ
ncbi:cupin domain-containing protein [Hamadaea tsunoensis]|uniref:cupin n=1 Tax=Hamadaea tsunoensis TaxID=53368 RepID=UPI000482087A